MCKTWWTKEELLTLMKDWYECILDKEKYNRTDPLHFKVLSTQESFSNTVRRFVSRGGTVLPPSQQTAHRLGIFKEKYGVTSFMSLKEVQQKAQDSYIANHGGMGNQSETVKRKFNTTMLEKYGSEWSMNDPVSLQNHKNTMQDRYGHDFSGQAFKEKISATKLERYGHSGAPNVKWESKPEKEIKEIFKEFNPKKTNLDGRQFDVCFIDQKILVEFNGLYWHSEEKVGKNYHIDKTKLAEKHGFRLIHIFSHIWEERKPQVIDFLRSALGANSSLYARKCYVQKIDADVAYLFCQENHIQGGVRRPHASFGLFNTETKELVSVMCFSKHHRNNTDYTLSRFCSSRGVNVVGGFSKLQKQAFAYFTSIGINKLYSWSDTSISQGKVYLTNGWSKDHTLKPDYFYFKGRHIIAKQARMKSKVGTPADMTESQHAAIDGLSRVWDCGKTRFSITF